MTQKLYYDNAYLAEFDAVIESVVERNGRTAIVLDRTAFFPEGGGQPGDTGAIGGVRVVDTQISEDTVYHYVSGSVPFSAGECVHCALDWEKRFARMQAHTGEHIVSGIAHSLYSVENVGFHMDDTLMTVDFDRYLSKEELSVLERTANMCVYKNVPVRTWFPDAETIRTLRYRSKSDNFTSLRIVTIEGYDDCACCAVHVSHTGEVGLIKILSSVSHRGGVRITLICGIEAYRDYTLKHESTLRIADLLAARHGETAQAVEQLIKKEKDLRWQIGRRTAQLFRYAKDNTAFSEGNLVFCFEELLPEELKTAAVTMCEKCAGLCVAVSENPQGGYYFAIASNTVRVTDYTKTITSALQGSGGGRFDVIQGRFSATLEQIRSFFSEYKVN